MLTPASSGNYYCNGAGACYVSCGAGATATCATAFCKSKAWCSPAGNCVGDLGGDGACILDCQCKSNFCAIVLGVPFCF
mgnify:CR=1 FL=1